MFLYTTEAKTELKRIYVQTTILAARKSTPKDQRTLLSSRLTMHSFLRLKLITNKNYLSILSFLRAKNIKAIDL